MSITNIKVSFSNGNSVDLSPKQLSPIAIADINRLIVEQLIGSALAVKSEPATVDLFAEQPVNEVKVTTPPAKGKRRDLSRLAKSFIANQVEAYKVFDTYDFSLSDLLSSPLSRKSRVDGGVTRDNSGQRLLTCEVIRLLVNSGNSGLALESFDRLSNLSSIAGVELATTENYIASMYRLGILSKDPALSNERQTIYYLSEHFIKQAL